MDADCCGSVLTVFAGGTRRARKARKDLIRGQATTLVSSGSAKRDTQYASPWVVDQLVNHRARQTLQPLAIFGGRTQSSDSGPTVGR